MNKRIAAGFAAGALLIGGIGATVALPHMVAAADPTATAATTPASSTAAGTTSNGSGPAAEIRNHRGPGGLDADDLTAAAKALGMTEADLTTALNGGQTTAAVAKAKGVDIQTVIDAIVAADKAEIEAAVKAGTLTQAQADQRLANLTTHVTDEVNGVAGGPGGFGGHGPGGHGPGGPGGDGHDGQVPAGTSGSSGTSAGNS